MCRNECDPHLCLPGLLQHQTERFQWCLRELLLDTSVTCYSLHKHFQFLCNCQIHLCLLHVSPDGAADTSVCPCMAPSLLFHYLLHCLVYFTLAQNANGQFSTLLRTLPIVLIVVPFGVIAEEYDLVRDANNCSCW